MESAKDKRTEGTLDTNDHLLDCVGTRTETDSKRDVNL